MTPNHSASPSSAWLPTAAQVHTCYKQEHMSMCTHIDAPERMHAHMYMQWPHACKHASICTHRHTHTHAYCSPSSSHTCTHTHTHICQRTLTCQWSSTSSRLLTCIHQNKQDLMKLRCHCFLLGSCPFAFGHEAYYGAGIMLVPDSLRKCMITS